MEASGALIQSKDNGKILLLLRGRGSSHTGTWAFVGGAIDEGETPIQALEREVFEEIGVDSGVIKYTYIGHIGNLGQADVFYLYYGSVDTEFVPKIDYNEHTDWAWYDLDLLPMNTYPGLEDEIDFILNKVNGKGN